MAPDAVGWAELLRLAKGECLVNFAGALRRNYETYRTPVRRFAVTLHSVTCKRRFMETYDGIWRPRKTRTPPVRARMRHECRSVNRNCCLGIWNLYFVFQFPNRRARCVSWILHGDIWILKSVQAPKSAARRGIWILDGPRRFLETVQFSKIRGEAWNLESGWPEPVLGNW